MQHTLHGGGCRFAEWLAEDDEGPYGSWGNGAAMRVSPAAFLATSLEQARSDAVRVTEVSCSAMPSVRRGSA